MSNFRPIDHHTAYLFPPSVDEWLPQRHLARFVVEAVDGLDLSAMVKGRGSGSASYHPAMLLCSGQVILATVFWVFQYCCSATTGGNPSLCVCGLSRL